MIQISLEELLPILQQVYDMTYRKEILKESVPNEEKIFSIYEHHTDIIMKGSRVVIGSFIVKHKMKLDDGETIECIRENMYVQYFLGSE